MPSLRTTVYGGNASADVVLDVEDGATGADLSDGLRALGYSAGRVAVDGRVLDDRVPVLDHPVVQGSRSELVRARPSDEPADGPRGSSRVRGGSRS